MKDHIVMRENRHEPDAAPTGTYTAQMTGYRHDPLAHAAFAYPWGEGALKGVTGPRAWQRDVMAAIGEHLQNPKTRHTPCRFARA